MSTVRHRGRRVPRYEGGVMANTVIFDYRSPGVTLECEKLLDHPDELAKLSGEVKTYKKGELDNDRLL